jgi:hypothetical protein
LRRKDSKVSKIDTYLKRQKIYEEQGSNKAQLCISEDR